MTKPPQVHRIRFYDCKLICNKPLCHRCDIINYTHTVYFRLQVLRRVTVSPSTCRWLPRWSWQCWRALVSVLYILLWYVTMVACHHQKDGNVSLSYLSSLSPSPCSPLFVIRSISLIPLPFFPPSPLSIFSLSLPPPSLSFSPALLLPPFLPSPSR